MQQRVQAVGVDDLLAARDDQGVLRRQGFALRVQQVHGRLLPDTNFVADALQGARRGCRLIGRRLDHGARGLHILPGSNDGLADLGARNVNRGLRRANIRAGLADPAADEAPGEQCPAPLDADGHAVGSIAGEELVAGRAGRGGQRHGWQPVGLRVTDAGVRRAGGRLSGQILALKDVGGVLVGGASLKASDFLQIVRAAG